MSPGRRIALFALAVALVAAAAGTAAKPAAGSPVEVRICAGLEEAAPPGSGPVLLVFFATDCPVCYEDLFEARYLAAKRRWPVEIVGIASGPREDLSAFLEKHAWTLPVVLDARRTLAKRFKAGPAPFKVLLVGKEAVYRDDPYLGLDDRRKELDRCLKRLFSR